MNQHTFRRKAGLTIFDIGALLAGWILFLVLITTAGPTL